MRTRGDGDDDVINKHYQITGNNKNNRPQNSTIRTFTNKPSRYKKNDSNKATKVKKKERKKKSRTPLKKKQKKNETERE